jgi:DNA mismatch repair protein MutL
MVSAIRQLSNQVINQIAAGEVVERPVSVVKELVENAIDAGSTNIKVSIENGGKSLIRISDNGSGIAKADLFNATKRHWTSKITSVDDLNSITTMGFRGEALSSIAAVSKFTLRSRVKEDEHGWEYVTENDEVHTRPVGMPAGTEVIVRDLFYNVPARQNFLKGDQTESAHIQTLIYQLALSHPHIAFTLTRNQKTVFKTSGDSAAHLVLPHILGKELSEKMIAVATDDPHMTVRGFVGRPGIGVTSNPRQFVFVNNRPVDEHIVRGAVHKAYDSLLGRGEKPHYIIMIEIAPHLVDFNVHPQKKEVRFMNSNVVYQLVHQAVDKALMGFDPVQTIGQNETSQIDAADSDKRPSGYDYGSLERMSSGGSGNRYPASSSDSYSYSPAQEVLPIASAGNGFGQTSVSVSAQSRVFQLLNLFILEEVGDGMMVYDQHAVHERVLYEQLSASWRDSNYRQATQSMLVPQKVELTPIEFASWQDANLALGRMGFVMNEIDTNTIEVRQVPAVFSDHNVRSLIREYLTELVREDEAGLEFDDWGIDAQTHRRLAYMACRGAIKAGDPLTEIEIRRLLDDYKNTTIRFTCPHGRPVQVKIDRSEMEKWFRRS